MWLEFRRVLFRSLFKDKFNELLNLEVIIEEIENKNLEKTSEKIENKRQVK